MWQLRTLSLLVLTSFCLAAPQQSQQPTNVRDASNLDDLIGSVFNNNKPGRDGGNIDGMIDNVFNNNNQGGNVATERSAGLPALVDEVFGTGTNTQGGVIDPANGSGTILGNKNPSNLPKPGDCECIPYYQCQNGTAVTDGKGLIDLRSGFGGQNNQSSPSVAGRCENYLDICCKTSDIVSNEERITPRPVERNGCGRRNPDGVGFRITGDNNNEAQFGEFPWMVAILREEKVDEKSQTLKVYQCGGALIHPQAVLTAAHCVNGRKAEQLKVRAGEWDTQTKNEIFAHQDRDVSKVIIHEQFNSGNLRNDYAILILSSPVDLAENVDVICLPQQNEQFDGSRCFASGWGKDVFGQAGHYQVILKRVELPVVSRPTCQNSLRTTRLGRYFVLDTSFICAGGEPGRDTCKGDGGSPLVCPLRNDPSKYVQAGMVAWGIGCGENGIPGVYANVAAGRRWIDEQIAYNNLDTNVYTY